MFVIGARIFESFQGRLKLNMTTNWDCRVGSKWFSWHSNKNHLDSHLMMKLNTVGCQKSIKGQEIKRSKISSGSNGISHLVAHSLHALFIPLFSFRDLNLHLASINSPSRILFGMIDNWRSTITVWKSSSRFVKSKSEFELEAVFSRTH